MLLGFVEEQKQRTSKGEGERERERERGLRGEDRRYEYAPVRCDSPSPWLTFTSPRLTLTFNFS